MRQISVMLAVVFLGGCLSSPRAPAVERRLAGVWRYYRPVRDRRFGPRSQPVFLTLSPGGKYRVLAVYPAARRLPGGRLEPTQFYWDARGEYRLAGGRLRLLMTGRDNPTAELALMHIPGFDRARGRVDCGYTVTEQTLTLSAGNGRITLLRVDEGEVPRPQKPLPRQ